MKKKALITGITGQDGCYLAQFLLGKGYQVHGIVRPKQGPDLKGLRYLGIDRQVHLSSADLAQGRQVQKIVGAIKPDEIYNLAAMSSVARSFQKPLETIEFNLNSTTNVLEAARLFVPHARIYQASSSEMFGRASRLPATEKTPFDPVSPYGISKVFCHWKAHHYRRMHHMFCACGILFNHESVLRPGYFVTKKIIATAVRIKHGSREKLKLGNIRVQRDWGYAPEYVKAMWLMLQQKIPDDYILATNKAHSLEEFVSTAFGYLGLDWKKHVVVDKILFRPSDIDVSRGNPAKIKRGLGWVYDLRFKDLIKLLIDEEQGSRGKF
ncbi:MAG: GDP-mannose 4,6-dehydratase [Candidatus Omnitrophota bacterium]|nr:GDP-mannose 4,6-dehydratase [Candidatus Omnitrophota bacterium]